MLDKALAEVQKGVQLSSLCLPSSTPLNINGCTHTSRIRGCFNCLQIFLIKDLTFCLCGYTNLSLSSRRCPLRRSLSSAPRAPAGSARCSAGEQTPNGRSRKCCGGAFPLTRWRDGVAPCAAQPVARIAPSRVRAAGYWCHWCQVVGGLVGLAPWTRCLKSRSPRYSPLGSGECTRLHGKRTAALGTTGLTSPESPPGPLTTETFSLTN